MSKWNEVGPPTLTDAKIYERHNKLVQSNLDTFLKETENRPYYIVDPFDHLFNPARKIKKYDGHEWENKEDRPSWMPPKEETKEVVEEQPEMLYP